MGIKDLLCTDEIESCILYNTDPESAVSASHEGVAESVPSQGQDSSDPPENRHTPSNTQQSEGDLQTESEEKTAL